MAIWQHVCSMVGVTCLHHLTGVALSYNMEGGDYPCEAAERVDGPPGAADQVFVNSEGRMYI
jgi:hypothetical protein